MLIEVRNVITYIYIYIEKIALKVVQIKFLAMRFTNRKFSLNIFTKEIKKISSWIMIFT